VFWFLSRRFPVVVTEYHHLRVFLVLERIFPRRRRHLVLLQFIHVSADSWNVVGRTWPRSELRRLFERHVIRPALSRSVLRAQVLSRDEYRRQTAYFSLPESTVQYIPWPLSTPLRHGSPGAPGKRVGVFASGRAACDWEAVFAIAEGEEWPLTIVCGSDDLRRVERLNASGRASVSSEVQMAVHDGLVRDAAVYLLALKEARASSGHIRLGTAIQSGTPVVASNVHGLADYLRPGVNALVFEPGDVATAKSEIRRLLQAPEFGARLARTAVEVAREWTYEDYIGALRALVDEACDVATASV
jgi:hypothetical protein